MAELHRQGLFPEEIAGTSSGSIVAAICGLGHQTDEVENFVLKPKMRTCFWDWLAPLRLPGVITSAYSSGILSGSNAVLHFRKAFEGARLENFQSPKVQIAATNLTTRESKMISQGDAASWVVASCAIPGLFCNQIIDGARWCDGGVAIHVPFDHWFKSPDIHTIIIHQIDHSPGTELTTKWPTISTGIAAAHETICKVTCDLRYQLAEFHGKRLILMNTCAPHPGLFPCKQRYRMIEKGQETAQRCIKELKEQLQQNLYTPAAH